MKGIFDDPAADAALQKAKRQVAKLAENPKARDKFAALVRSALPPTPSGDVDAATEFMRASGDELFRRLSRPAPQADMAAAASAAALAAPAVGAIQANALQLLNFVTYYQMKERAGLVGSTGVNRVLRTLRARQPGLKLHLIGHSFGGRLVTAATTGADGQAPVGVTTLTLWQAAFSHYGFAQRYDGEHDGFFRGVVTSHDVAGPTLISHTRNDEAVGYLYPLASLLAGQVASLVGGPDDLYGGLGSNGAREDTRSPRRRLAGAGPALCVAGG